MRLQMEMAEKLADGFSPHAAFEAKHKQSGHDQADEPVSACLGFPQRRLRIAVAAVHRLEVTMHTAFGKSGVLRKASDALLPVFTNRVENDQALGPQSHSGGPCSEGWLTWCLKSALQSTRSTTHCPALETWPGMASEPVPHLHGRCMLRNCSIGVVSIMTVSGSHPWYNKSYGLALDVHFVNP